MSVRVSIWGLGEHARRNLIPSLMSCENIDLVGVWSRSKEKRDSVAKETDSIPYQSESELLSDPLSNAVLISTPTGLHFNHGNLAMESGKDIWVEKSLTSSQYDSEKIVNLAKDRNLNIYELFMFLFHPQFERIESIIRSGKIGSIKTLYAKFGFPHISSENFRYDKNLGGGSLLDAGCYTVATSHRILGPNPNDIYCNIEYDTNLGVDISGIAVLSYENDVSAVLQWGFGLSYRNEIEIWGTEGHLKAERAFSKPKDLVTKIEVKLQSGDSETIEIEPENHFSVMFNEISLPSEKSQLVGHKWCIDQANLMGRIASSINKNP